MLGTKDLNLGGMFLLLTMLVGNFVTLYAAISTAPGWKKTSRILSCFDHVLGV